MPYAGTVTRNDADRLPAAGPARGRPVDHRPRPGALRPRAGRSGRRSGQGAVGDGRAGRRPGAGRRGQPVRPHRGAVLRARRLRRRVRGGPDLRQPRPAGPGAEPADAPALRRPAAAGRAVPHPVRRLRRHGSRRRHVAAGRADEPPRPRLDRLAAGLPAAVLRRHRGHLARRRAVGRRGQQGLVPGRRPRRAGPVQHGLAALPGGQEQRRAAPSPGTRQRREEGVGAARPGGEDGRQGDQGGRRALDDQAGREDAVRPGRGPQRRQGRQDPVPAARAVRPDAADRVRTCPRPTGRSRCSPASTWPSTAGPGWWCSASTAPARPPC